jgi:hypothetical protein
MKEMIKAFKNLLMIKFLKISISVLKNEGFLIIIFLKLINLGQKSILSDFLL